MKFGKWLKRQIEQSLPAWKDEFLSYNELKPVIGAVSPAEFVARLDVEIEKINAFFIEQEEFFIITHRGAIRSALERKPAVPASAHEAEIAAIRREIVNFHGEMVLLLNYSSVNYIGLAKILKKYDKRTGAGIRLAVIETVLVQPFFTAEAVSLMLCRRISASPAAPRAPAPRGANVLEEYAVRAEAGAEDAGGGAQPASSSGAMFDGILGARLELELERVVVLAG
ncbi:hypothetical protein TRIUR3_16388 [Triticum urartu]|uniref:SPX domain-containing protein n=2 Tax=Triticum TaxID=4564 RepID=A0A9R1NN62_TRITD|nr:hypothetical protein TRIUR3_16388 [Triticum urartu]VAH28039.1 unnamed protein product [Triticum turgidum subsp. durum]